MAGAPVCPWVLPLQNFPEGAIRYPQPLREEQPKKESVHLMARFRVVFHRGALLTLVLAEFSGSGSSVLPVLAAKRRYTVVEELIPNQRRRAFQCGNH